ncbi:hypothetical protein TrVFT333_001624 [Trichoderma virens FT-333]|nr:hypothetical protein TrVFT333_001624 [Trichoderma virens FT-333]
MQNPDSHLYQTDMDLASKVYEHGTIGVGPRGRDRSSPIELVFNFCSRNFRVGTLA